MSVLQRPEAKPSTQAPKEPKYESDLPGTKLERGQLVVEAEVAAGFLLSEPRPLVLEATDEELSRGMALGSAFAFFDDPGEDIYALEDGDPPPGT